MRKPDCQLTSADGSDLNVAGVCKARSSKHSHSINADVYVLRGYKKNLIGIFKLRQFALKDDDDVQRSGVSGFDIQDNSDKVLNCNGIVDVSAAFM